MNRPRVKEDDLDIEDDEKESEEIIAEVKLNPRPPYGFHSALIGGALDGIGFTGTNSKEAKDAGKYENNNTEKKSYQKEQRYIAILSQHSLLSSQPRLRASVYHGNKISASEKQHNLNGLFRFLLISIKAVASEGKWSYN